MKEIKNKKRVIIGMSGGVDSSVAAALLKKQGYEAIGVFMKFWGGENRCCSPESEKRARLVARKLDIPFYVSDFRKEFKEKVVDYFLENYKLGLTPNPCVVCNKEIKFGLLFKKMLSLDADYIATGHYACIKTQNSKRNKFRLRASKTQNHNLKLKTFKLLKGKDKQKDQSYFLWKLNQKILKRTLFPVGDYTKTEVRKSARKFKLPVLNVPESMEICFIQTTINDFLKKRLKTNPGRIVDAQGKTIGKHQGLWFYTIGQRKGIGISGSKPYYVLNKDLKKNTLIVTKNKKDLYKKELTFKNVSWISEKKPKFPLKVMAKIRYRHKPASVIVRPVRGYGSKKEPQNKQTSNGVQGNRVIFDKPQRAITPGQSVVFYLPRGKAGKGQELLGGGTIDYNFYLK